MMNLGVLIVLGLATLVLANEVPEQPIEQQDRNNQVEQYYRASSEDNDADKRAWKDMSTGWGKRGWKDLQSAGWGKRGWQDLNGSGWGKRAWSDMQSSGWGKRAWSDLPSSGWGKRAWSDLPSSGWGKRAWSNLQSPGWGKRAWSDLQSSGWGKRAWKDLHGSGWGKRGWNDLQGAGWGKRSVNPQMRLNEENDEDVSLVNEQDDKRSLSNLRATWGKPAHWSTINGPNEIMDEIKSDYTSR